MPKLPFAAAAIATAGSCWLMACEKRNANAIITPPRPHFDEAAGRHLAGNRRKKTRGDTLVYRPNTYGFLTGAGPHGLSAIGSYGRFEQFDLAPTGGLTWPGGHLDGGRRQPSLRIHLTDGEQSPDYTFEILSLTASRKSRCSSCGGSRANRVERLARCHDASTSAGHRSFQRTNLALNWLPIHLVFMNWQGALKSPLAGAWS